MFIAKKRKKGKTYYEIIDKVDGKNKSIRHLGSCEKILENYELLDHYKLLVPHKSIPKQKVGKIDRENNYD